MFNHARGLWGYTGTAADGGLLTIQATGMGGPSAAIVVEELVDLGASVLVRAGTCGALAADIRLGELVSARELVAADGASAGLGAGERLAPDSELAGALEAGGARPVTAVSTDLFYDPREDVQRGWAGQGVQVVEMEGAALLAVAGRRGARAAVLLAVSDELGAGSRRRIEAEELEAVELRLGEVGVAALGARAPDRRP